MPHVCLCSMTKAVSPARTQAQNNQPPRPTVVWGWGWGVDCHCFGAHAGPVTDAPQIDHSKSLSHMPESPECCWVLARVALTLWLSTNSHDQCLECSASKSKKGVYHIINKLNDVHLFCTYIDVDSHVGLPETRSPFEAQSWLQ